jgi:hypothetical protein
MTDHPIDFSAPEILALLSGRKLRELLGVKIA